MTDNRLLYLYRKGFDDELDGVFNESFTGSELEIRAYNLGSYHAILGDDVKSVDCLSEKEIIKLIRDGKKSK